MKKLFIFPIILVIFFFPMFQLSAQVSISSDNSPADNSAILDLKSTNKGLLIPRMTTVQISGIVNPADGLQIYNTTDGKLYIYVSFAHVWKEVNYGAGTIIPPFSCGNPITDSRDGKTYNTVQIGTQCWFAQNLNVGSKILGSADQINNGIIEKYCYNNNDANCTVYGGLYQWAEMVQYLNGASNSTSWNPVPTENIVGICPIGWHIPSDSEWTILTTYLGGTDVASGKIKEVGTVHWAAPNPATNSSGFTALPGGYRAGSSGPFRDITYAANFWASSQYDINRAMDRLLLYDTVNIHWGASGKNNGFSVRCIKD